VHVVLSLNIFWPDLQKESMFYTHILRILKGINLAFKEDAVKFSPSFLNYIISHICAFSNQKLYIYILYVYSYTYKSC